MRPSPFSSIRPIFIFIIVLLLVAFLGYFFFFSSSHSVQPFYSVDQIENCQNLSRDSYGVSPVIFSALPPPPSCFVSSVDAYRSNLFSDIFFFDSSYFLQPEFFPVFLSEGLRAWENPNDTHYGAVGFGSYPFSSSLSLSARSPARFFIYSGFGIRSVQSVSLRWEFENPSDANLFSITLDENSSPGFLLGPTFPKFHPAWVHAVDVRVISLASSFSSSSVVHFYTAPSSADFSSDPLVSSFPFFDSTDYVGEKRVFTLTISP